MIAPRPLILPVAALTLIGLSLRYWNFTVDDVFISFRYAENLVAGHGLTYNPGVHVEGYSNLLFTLVLALGRLIGLNLLLWAKTMNLAAGLGLLVLFWRWPGSAPSTRIASISCLAVHQSLALWASNGMETVVFVFLLYMGGFFLVRTRAGKRGLVAGGACYGLAAITRPEGAMFFLPALFIMRRRRMTSAPTLALFLPFVLPALGQYLFRGVYYGNLFPQTFYTKVGFDPAGALSALRHPVLSFLVFGITPVGLLALLPRGRGRWEGPEGESRYLFTSYLLLAAVLVCVVGWDWMPGLRLLLPALPGGLWLAARGIEDVSRSSRGARERVLRWAGPAALVLAVFFLSNYKVGRDLRPFAHRSGWANPSARWEGWVDRDRLEAARWLGAHALPGQVLATGEGGLVPWLTRLRVVDTWGLTDPVAGAMVRPFRPESMIRYRAQGEQDPLAVYVRGRRPDFIFTHRTEVIPPDTDSLLDGTYRLAHMTPGGFLIFTRTKAE